MTRAEAPHHNHAMAPTLCLQVRFIPLPSRPSCQTPLLCASTVRLLVSSPSAASKRLGVGWRAQLVRSSSHAARSVPHPFALRAQSAHASFVVPTSSALCACAPLHHAALILHAGSPLCRTVTHVLPCMCSPDPGDGQAGGPGQADAAGEGTGSGWGVHTWSAGRFFT